MDKKSAKNRSRTPAFLLLSLGAANAADYFFTVEALAAGGRKINPVMGAIVDTPLFPALKLVMLPAALVFIWLAMDRLERLRRVVLAGLWTAFAAYAGAMVWHVHSMFLLR